MHQEKRPRPSLPLAPPKIILNVALFGRARQKTLKPVKIGMIHSGMISGFQVSARNLRERSSIAVPQQKMQAKTIRNTLSGFFIAALLWCRASSMLLTGKLEGHSMFFGYKSALRMSPAKP